MTAPVTATNDRIAASTDLAAARPPQPLFWSVRRELWEHPYVVVGPLFSAFILLAVIVLGTFSSAGRLADVLELAGEARRRVIVHPYLLTVAMVALGGFFVTLFYCSQAFRGERQDRSILFWKSLPVSDTTTVLAKAIVVLVVLPMMFFLVALGVNGARLLSGTLALMLTGHHPVALWRELSVELPLVFLLDLATLALQLAPLYGWLLVVSAWARRWALLWALLPLYVVIVAERPLLGTSHAAKGLLDLLVGSFTRSFSLDFHGNAPHPLPIVDRLAQFDFAGLFGRPQLWVGLAFTAACLAAAIRLRRDREPV